METAVQRAPTWMSLPLDFMLHEFLKTGQEKMFDDMARRCLTSCLHAVLIKCMILRYLVIFDTEEHRFPLAYKENTVWKRFLIG